MKLRRGIVFGLTAAMALSLTACGGAKTESTKGESAKAESANTEGGTSEGKSSFSIAMITDTGGINDQSFNQSAWEGLTELKNEKGVEVNYIESKQASDFVTNLERLGDSGANLLWGVGYACADAVLEAADSNPDIQYAIIDNAYDDTPDNVTGVMFRAQEPSFMVGYVAGRMTETNKVGFVGGISSGLIDQFQYGYEAGVKYAAKELGKDIDISVQYAESFSDAAKGKAIVVGITVVIFYRLGTCLHGTIIVSTEVVHTSLKSAVCTKVICRNFDELAKHLTILVEEVRLRIYVLLCELDCCAAILSLKLSIF